LRFVLLTGVYLEMDFLIILGTIGFFLIAIGYTVACGRLK